MNLLQKLVASAKISDVIDFGIIDNVILKDVTNDEQIYDGQVIEKNCHMRFQRLTEKGTPYQEFRSSYFNANPKESKKPLERLVNQMKQLAEISTAVNEKCGASFGTKLNKVLGSVENMETKARSTKKSEAKDFQHEIVDVFVANIKPYLEDKPLLRLKIVTSWDGKYTNLPDSGSIIEPMSKEVTNLVISHNERINYTKSLTSTQASKVITPDSNGQTPKINRILTEL